jgi:aminomethyltransferase
VETGARIIEFAAWLLPVWYSGISDEHNAVRNFAGVFDVSHMGRFRVVGRGATDFLQFVTCNDAARLKPGKAQYTALLTDTGGTVDDLIIYKESVSIFWAVVNAGNRATDWDWMNEHIGRFPGTTLEDWSDAYALIAFQGPRAVALSEPLFSPSPAGLSSFGHEVFDWGSRKVRIARTGYTGEDGIEVFVPAGRAELLWDQILSLGGENGTKATPCGLGARDTLRLEAGLPLYGHELSDTLSPLDIGFAWMVKMQKGEFIGKKALEARMAEGTLHRLYGLRGESGVPRHGDAVFLRDPDGSPARQVGFVTSGTFSPYLRKPIGMFVSRDTLAPDTPLLFSAHNTFHTAVLVDLPFKRR